MILRPILGFLAACVLLYRRGYGWDSLGLRRPANIWIAIAGAAALYAVNWALARWVVPALAQLLQPQREPSFLGYIRGDVNAFLLWVAIAFVFAAVMALASGAFYLILGRNLWPLIAVHGVWNTLAMWSIYSR